jgi:sugar phosphate isomerase/epimerase
MRLSILLFLTDILPKKRRFFNKLVKNKLFDKHVTRQIFENLKKHGIEGVEILLPSFVTTQDIREVKKAVDENGIKVLSVHQALRFITKTRISEIRNILEAAKVLSAKVVVLHMNSAGTQLFDEKYIKEIHSLQKKYGIKIGFENREKYLGSAFNGYGWDEFKFAELMKKKDLYITYDVCHMGQAGGDIISFFEKNKDRIVNIHLSDYRSHYLNSSLRPIRFKHLPLGKGSLPIVDFLKVLRREDYKGLLTLETNTDLEELIKSADIIKNTS